MYWENDHPLFQDEQRIIALQGLSHAIDGELHLDLLHQMLYQSDASIYAMRPLGVVYPKHAQDLQTIVQFAIKGKIPLIPRAAGTSLSGQCVGQGLIVDISKHMTKILEINVKERWARVQPGVVLDLLNQALEPHGLIFGPDTSTSNRCMIGGMIGNNSCGSHSIYYGDTRDNILELKVILGDGQCYSLTDLDSEKRQKLMQKGNFLGQLLAFLEKNLETHAHDILQAFPKTQVRRRNTGYALDLLKPSWNLSTLMCGSEGTLGLITEAKVKLLPRPKYKALIAAHFSTLRQALEGTVLAMEQNPAAVELMDRPILDAAKHNLEQGELRQWVQGDPEAILIIEFYDHDPHHLKVRLKQCIDIYQTQGMGTAFPIFWGQEGQKVWSMRKAGLGLLMGIQGPKKVMTFIEDTAVAVEDLPDYVEEIDRILKKYQTHCVYYGHASVGELHLRPLLNPRDPQDRLKIEAIAKEVAQTVQKYQGSLSGEHGDGRVRGALLESFLGPKVYALLKEVKRRFDPHNIFNPGKIVDVEDWLKDWRYDPKDTLPEIHTAFYFRQDQGSLLKAVERCNGAGVCRQPAETGGHMCPSYQVTGDEKNSTRGRSNVLRTLLLKDHSSYFWLRPELKEVFDLCVSCKACKRECPANVDMARLKAEYLHQRHQLEGVGLRDRFFGDPEWGYQWLHHLQKWGLMQNLWENPFVQRSVQKVLGIHPQRTLPKLAPQTLRERIQERGLKREGKYGTVILFIDLFTHYHEPELGLAALDLLEEAGYRVLILDHDYSGRTQISRGLLDQAKAKVLKNLKIFEPYLDQVKAIVGIEPSAILTLKDEYLDLAPPSLLNTAQRVAEKALPIEVFLVQQHQRGQLDLQFDATPRKILLHGHCHQKALMGDELIAQCLRLVDAWEVEVLNTGCCGMAGSFGYEEEHYEISMAMGEQLLFPKVRASHAETWIAASGTSCRHQILEGTHRLSEHPIALLRRVLRVSKCD